MTLQLNRDSRAISRTPHVAGQRPLERDCVSLLALEGQRSVEGFERIIGRAGHGDLEGEGRERGGAGYVLAVQGDLDGLAQGLGGPGDAEQGIALKGEVPQGQGEVWPCSKKGASDRKRMRKGKVLAGSVLSSSQAGKRQLLWPPMGVPLTVTV